MRKTVAAAAMAASLTIGGAAGVALFSPSLSGAQTDESSEPAETTQDERPERGERLAELLAPLVEDGTITQAQADAVVARLADALPGPRGHGFRLDVAEAAAEALGLDVDELRERLADGGSLAEIAEAEGVEVQAVTDALVAAHQARLDEAVAAGDLTQDQADERAAAFADRVDDLVQRRFDGHRHGRHHGFRAPGDGEDTTES